MTLSGAKCMQASQLKFAFFQHKIRNALVIAMDTPLLNRTYLGLMILIIFSLIDSVCSFAHICKNSIQCDSTTWLPVFYREIVAVLCSREKDLRSANKFLQSVLPT